jgi:hypothetical protein
MTKRRERGKAKELDHSKYLGNSAEFNVPKEETKTLIM